MSLSPPPPTASDLCHAAVSRSRRRADSAPREKSVVSRQDQVRRRVHDRDHREWLTTRTGSSMRFRSVSGWGWRRTGRWFTPTPRSARSWPCRRSPRAASGTHRALTGCSIATAVPTRSTGCRFPGYWRPDRRRWWMTWSSTGPTAGTSRSGCSDSRYVRPDGHDHPRHRRLHRHHARDGRGARPRQRRGPVEGGGRSRPHRDLLDRPGRDHHAVRRGGTEAAGREVGRPGGPVGVRTVPGPPHHFRLHPSRAGRRLVLLHRAGWPGHLRLLDHPRAERRRGGRRRAGGLARHERAAPSAGGGDPERPRPGDGHAGGQRRPRDQQSPHLRDRQPAEPGVHARPADRHAGRAERPARGGALARGRGRHAPGSGAGRQGCRAHREHHP